MSSEMDMFKDLFLQSAREHVQHLNDTLLNIEEHPEQVELVEELMRDGHSLKGESAAMGYDQLATLAHVVEDFFTGVGSGKFAMTSELADALFTALDHVSSSLDSIASSAEGKELNMEDHVAKLKGMTGLTTEGFGKSGAAAAAAAAAEAEKSDVNTAAVDTSTVETEDTNPALTEPLPAEPPAALPTTAESEVKPEGGEARKDSATEQISTVTITIDKLDKLISVSEELVLLKMQLKSNPVVLSDTHLKAEIHRLDRLVTDMQFQVMQARLFPISIAIHTLPRLVRDTSHKTGKKVRLEIEGEDTTVDRTIIDHLSEPFVHMIRNAIDHGIESPEVRKANGKPEEAVVRINAYTKENKFFVEISDDGGGIEWEKLKASSIKKGMYTEEETETWTMEEMKHKLLFKGGLSASETVTDISGRGVGLDAVQQAILKLGGGITIDTVVGKGTTFTIRLPMTLAIMQALLVNVVNEVYALPSNNVVRSITVERKKIQSAGNLAVIAVDGQQVPLYDLARIFDIKQIVTEAEEGSDERRKADLKRRIQTIVLVQREGGMMGCVVDKILADEEVLVKQLGPLLKNSKHFSGATILADGTCAPIVNFEGI